MKNLKWRLTDLPTGGEIADLVAQEVITKEEAREILFSTPSDKDNSDTKALKAEINFLRELVEKLASKTNYYPQVWQTINTKPYVGYPWYLGYSNTFSGTGYYNAVGTTSTAGILSATSQGVTTSTQSALSLGRYSVN